MSSLVLSYGYFWDDISGKDDTSLTDEYKMYDEFGDAAFIFEDLIGSSTRGYNSSGIRISPPVPLNLYGQYKDSKIYWNADIPASTSITIETSLSFDNGISWGAWTIVNNKDSIPNLTVSTDLTNVQIKTRQTLTSTNTNVTPRLQDFNISVSSLEPSTAKDTWKPDSRLLPRFQLSLEAGNVDNSGIKITKFAVKRRRYDGVKPVTIAYLPFINNSDVTYTDHTMPNDTFVYSIVPVGENNLEGKPNEVEVESSFTGWYIVDKDTNNVLAFDKFMDNGNPMFNTNYNQKKIQIDTFSKYPQFYYLDQAYHSFSLESVFLPEEWELSGRNYLKILNNFINNHKPYIIKSGNGEVYVCDISNLRKSTPQNAYKGHDYMVIGVDAVETEEYENFVHVSG